MQGAANNLATALGQAGLLGPGQNPKALAQHIVSNLVARGYGAKQGGQLLEQLTNALLGAQRAHGLGMSGKLDKATVALLRSLGIVSTQSSGAQGVLANKDSFERPKTANLPAKVSAQPVSQSKADGALERLANVLEQRMGDFGKTLAGAIRGFAAGAESLGQQIGQLAQRARDGVVAAVTRQPTETQTQDASAKTASQQSPALPAATTSTAAVTANPVGAAAAAAATLQSATTQNRSAVEGHVDPRAAGAQVGDALSDQGRGKKQGQGAGLLGEGEGGEGLDKDAKDQGLGDRDDPDMADGDDGNAASGDDDFANGQRGQASLDDGSDDDGKHYKVPNFSQQLETALGLITREAEQVNKATTYSWDFVLYKPGVYSAKQKADELLHVQVREALPFDQVWEQARVEIGKRIRRYDSQALPPTSAEIQVALRRARVRSAHVKKGLSN